MAWNPGRMLIAALLFLGCRADDPVADTGGEGTTDGAESCPATDSRELPLIDESACAPLDTDYQPLADMSAADAWPACATDDGAYHLLDATPSSIARVEAFEDIAAKLWRNGVATAQDFTDARAVYAQDEGLESRLVRREDHHYAPIPESDWEQGVEPDKQCTVEANVAKYPKRCAGPSTIGPMIQDAFAAGQVGEGSPEIHAATIEAGILWFYYLSTYKECSTCTAKAKDCDSCWAYYTGGFDRGGGIGLAGEVRLLSETTHNAVWDGFSAVRCWRELYPIEDYPELADVPAEGQALFENAWEQLDNALHRGFALVVRDRLDRQHTLEGPAAAANWAFIQKAGRVLDREAVERDPARAGTFAAVMSETCPVMDDVEAGVAALDEVFPCPQR